MQRRLILQAALAASTAAWLPAARAAGSVVLIGHPGIPRIDMATVQRLYLGRAIEVAGSPVTVVALPSGSPVRAQFLASWLQSDEERYRAYWTVRRHIGRGTPPPELATPAELIDYVQRTPGAIGYIDAAQVTPGLNVIARAQ